MLTQLRHFSAVAALAAMTAACASSPPSSSGGSPAAASGSFPVTISNSNAAVTLRARPTRIVSLSPTVTEMLYAIGAGSQVVAVDMDSDYPASAPHTKLNALQPDTEAVASYRPDLLVASGLPAAQAAQFEKLGIPVLDEAAAAALDQTYAEIGQLGQATGHAAGAVALVSRMKSAIASIVKQTPRLPAGTSYYYELDQTYYSVTSTTFVGRLLSLLGLHSVADKARGAAAAGGYPQLSAEYILKADPAYVFLADTRCCKQSPASVAARPGWSALAAVQAGRVIPLDDDVASRWGPRIVDLLRAVSQAIRTHPVAK